MQLQRLILLEKTFQDGEALLRNREFSRAFATFDTLKVDIDAFTKNVKARQDAQQSDGGRQAVAPVMAVKFDERYHGNCEEGELRDCHGQRLCPAPAPSVSR